MDATKQKRIKTPVQHYDQINQEIHPGQTVAFCYSGSPGIRVGTVIKLTKHRVRVAYKYRWTTYDTGEYKVNEWNYLSTPERLLVLSDSLPAELTILKLKGLLP